MKSETPMRPMRTQKKLSDIVVQVPTTSNEVPRESRDNVEIQRGPWTFVVCEMRGESKDGARRQRIIRPLPEGVQLKVVWTYIGSAYCRLGTLKRLMCGGLMLTVSRALLVVDVKSAAPRLIMKSLSRTKILQLDL